MSRPPPPTSSPDRGPGQSLDALLERYLALLARYTSLRAEANEAQARVHQHVARANFVGGRRPTQPYGPADFDARARAEATLAVTTSPPERPWPAFALTAEPGAAPLRQLGVLVPPALRAAHAVAAADLLPRLAGLAGLDAEMAAVERAVRQAREAGA